MSITRKNHSLEKSLEKTVRQILSQPTAPFRESWVKRACLRWCVDNSIPCCEDRFGNLWVNVADKRAIPKTRLVFIAHLDHPGMVVQGFSRKGSKLLARAKWLGGGPLDIRNHEVQVFSHVDALLAFDGVIQNHDVNGRRGADDVVIEVKASRVFSWLGDSSGKSARALAEAICTPKGFKELGPWGACLWYRKHGVAEGVQLKDGKFHTKAADDLIGVCALLEALKHAGAPKGVALLLSRAEESGFHGAIDVLESKVLDPNRTLAVSVETSAHLPGAVLGGGPVVRLGDRTSVFDPSLVYWLQNHAEKLSAADKSFRFQRRVMDGGSCEATAFNCYGFKVAGISTPLEQYHNVQWEKMRQAPGFSKFASNAKLAAKKSRGLGGLTRDAGAGLTRGKAFQAAPEAVNASDVTSLARLAAVLMKNHREATKILQGRGFERLRQGLLKNHHAHVGPYLK